MLAKFAEDEKLEQMNAQKRRMRMAEHAREVQRLIDEKRQAFEAAKAREEAEDAAKWVLWLGWVLAMRALAQDWAHWHP